MRRLIALLALGVGLVSLACGSAGEQDEAPATGDEAFTGARTFVAKGTGYFPANTKMEGGALDVRENKLRTLQQFLDGKAEYVSVAMDSKAFKYATRLRIAELNTKFGREIIFRVVDTGGAFRGRGTARMDICTADEKASLDPTINGTLHVDLVDEPTPFVPTKEPSLPAAPPVNDSSSPVQDAGSPAR